MQLHMLFLCSIFSLFGDSGGVRFICQRSGTRLTSCHISPTRLIVISPFFCDLSFGRDLSDKHRSACCDGASLRPMTDCFDVSADAWAVKVVNQSRAETSPIQWWKLMLFIELQKQLFGNSVWVIALEVHALFIKFQLIKL